MSACALRFRARTAVALASIATLCVEHGANAQRSDSTTPITSSWPFEDAPASRVPGVAMLTTPKLHVLFSTQRGYDRLAIDHGIAAAVATCRSSLHISATQASWVHD